MLKCDLPMSSFLHTFLTGFAKVAVVPIYKADTVKPLNSGHLRVLKNLSVIERCPLLGGNFKKIVTLGT